MHFKIVIVWLLLTPFCSLAQIAGANLQAMINEEEAFARMASEKNTKDAFLFYLSDDAVTVGSSGPLVGKSAIKKRPANKSLLSWSVAYSDIASSGDFGYTTGPWEFRPVRDSLPAAFGEFHSIWKKQYDGSWKNFLDIGIDHPEPSTEAMKTSSKPPVIPAKKIPAAEAIVSLMKEENAFLQSYKKNGLSAYKTAASSEIRYSREGEIPILTTAQKTSFLKSAHPYFNPQLVDGAIASSGDMGYVYGTITAVLFIDNKQESKQATYLRVWKKEDGKLWRVVLDVIAYE
ncbi:MAG: nuclear transport factor 2 family protein [Chryseolinea sp.]